MTITHKTQIGNEVRQMTENEIAEWTQLVDELNDIAEANKAAVLARQSAISKLAALGLTQSEINALVG